MELMSKGSVVECTVNIAFKKLSVVFVDGSYVNSN